MAKRLELVEGYPNAFPTSRQSVFQNITEFSFAPELDDNGGATTEIVNHGHPRHDPTPRLTYEQ